MPHKLQPLIDANEARWSRAKVLASSANTFKSVAKKLSAPEAKRRYVALSKQTGVPWFIIAVIHQRESSQRWDRSIAQGDPWNKISTHVPKGRGPFSSFEEAAIDALRNCAPYAAKWKDWSPGGALTLLEQYNGLGYYNGPKAGGKRYPSMPSPYIWSGTDQAKKGKYVRDGVFDPDVWDSQLGCAGLILAMSALDDSVSFVGGDETSLPFSDLDGGGGDEDEEQNSPKAPSTDSEPIVVVEDSDGDEQVLNVQPQSGVYSAEVELIQSKLDKLGYHEVGSADGKFGGKTVAAIAAFKLDQGLEPDGKVNKAFIEKLNNAIADGWTRPISVERATKTAQDLAPEMPAVKQTLRQKLAAKIGAAFATGGGLLAAAKDHFSDARDYIQPVANFFSDIPPWLYFVVIGGIALGLYWSANNATKNLVDAKRSGKMN